VLAAYPISENGEIAAAPHGAGGYKPCAILYDNRSARP
jgi:hypothetical protein